MYVSLKVLGQHTQYLVTSGHVLKDYLCHSPFHQISQTNQKAEVLAGDSYTGIKCLPQSDKNL